MEIKFNEIVESCEFVKEGANKYGTIYYHRIKMINGDTGLYRSKKKEQTFFQPGFECNYSIDMDLKEKDFLIAPYRDKNNSNYQKTNSMADNNSSPKITALNCAIHFASKTNAEDKKVLNEALLSFTQWLLEKNTDKAMMNKQAVLKAAIDCIDVKVIGITTIDQVITIANENLAYVSN